MSENTFYFYDLETSGIIPSADRIMQFGGIRTDENFEIIDEPLECYVKLDEEVLPHPEAILVTGITPQKVNDEGYSEPEFIKILQEKMFQPSTIIAGFNNIRFDDEFLRYLMWRNLRDPYQWHWQDERSRIDVIDIVRTARALRPEGIKWPVDESGAPSNRLEKLTAENNIEHSQAHTALADVYATIEVMKLIKKSQPKLLEFMLNNRHKNEVQKLVNSVNPAPFVHVSGMIDSAQKALSVFYPLAVHPENPACILCYDLRSDPASTQQASADLLRKQMFGTAEELQKEGLERAPIKGVHINKSPSVAPMGVLKGADLQALNLDLKIVEENMRKLKRDTAFVKSLLEAYADRQPFDDGDVEAQLYKGFVSNSDRRILDGALSNDNFDNLKLQDPRLQELVLRYKARNFPQDLTQDEKQQFHAMKRRRLAGETPNSLGAEQYSKKLAQLIQDNVNSKKQFLLEELELYLQAILQ